MSKGTSADGPHRPESPTPVESVGNRILANGSSQTNSPTENLPWYHRVQKACERVSFPWGRLQPRAKESRLSPRLKVSTLCLFPARVPGRSDWARPQLRASSYTSSGLLTASITPVKSHGHGHWLRYASAHLLGLTYLSGNHQQMSCVAQNSVRNHYCIWWGRWSPARTGSYLEMSLMSSLDGEVATLGGRRYKSCLE